MPGPSRGARGAKVAVDGRGGDERGEDEREDVVSREGLDDRVDVGRRDGHQGEPPPQSAGRIRDVEVDERPAVEVEELRPEVARRTTCSPERTMSGPTRLSPRRSQAIDPARHEDEADDAVGDDEREVVGLRTRPTRRRRRGRRRRGAARAAAAARR